MDCPVSWSQDEEWRLFWQHPVASRPPRNLDLVLDAPDGADPPAGPALVEWLISRHPVLATQLRQDDRDGLRQLRHNRPDAADLVRDCPRAEFEATFDRLRATAFDPAEDTALRMVIGRQSGSPDRIGLVVPHYAADGWAMGFLRWDLEGKLAGQPGPPPSLTPCEVARLDRSEPAPERDAARQQVGSRLDRCLDPFDPAARSGRSSLSLTARIWPPAGYLPELARRCRVHPLDLVTAAAALALRELLAVSPIPLTVTVLGRPSIPLRRVVAPMVQHVPLVAEVGDAASPAELAAGIHAERLAALSLARFDGAEFRSSWQPTRTRYQGIHLNCYAIGTEPDPTGPAPEPDLAPQVSEQDHPATHDLYVGIRYEQALHINLEADAGLLSASDLVAWTGLLRSFLLGPQR